MMTTWTVVVVRVRSGPIAVVDFVGLAVHWVGEGREAKVKGDPRVLGLSVGGGRSSH